MDFRSIKNGLTKSIRRFPDKPGVRTIGAFSGLIKPEFNDWIDGRWRLGSGLFKSVLLSFRQPADPFGQMCWPQQSREIQSNYLFAPNIQLTFNSYPISNAFFKNHTANLQTSHQSMPAQRFDVRNFLKLSLSSNTFNGLWTKNQLTALLCTTSAASVSQSSNNSQHKETTETQRPQRLHREISTGATTALRTTERLFQQLAGMLPSRSVNRFSKSIERPTLITISNSARQWANFISKLIQRSPEHQHAKILDRSVAHQKSLSRVPLFVNGKTYREGQNRVGGTLLSSPGLQKLRTIDEAISSRQSFLKQLSKRFWLRQEQQEQRFASVVQKFAVSKSSNAETLTRQIQYFGPPPDLTYARSESPQFQQLVTALRDFRPAQNEIKAPAPQLPSIAQLTSQVRHELERELRIERERRGL